MRRLLVKRLRHALALAVYLVGAIVTSALRVAADVVTPRHRSCPAIVAVPLEARTDLEIALVAILVTLTPGTLALDVSEDRRTLFVHAMFARDPEAVVRSIQTGFERRVLEVLR